MHTWTECDAKSFMLRTGPNYEKNKAKAPSSEAFFDVVGLDVFRSGAKIDNIGSKVVLPEEWTSLETNMAGVPPLFIVNCQMPEVTMLGSPSFFSEITDGPGWTIAIYYRMKPEAAAMLAPDVVDSAPPALRLFAEYCKQAPEMESNPKSPWKGKFKICCRVDNIDELGLPFFITSYNSKPVLIQKTGNIIRGEGGKYVEMDVNVHNFGSIARGALQIISFDKMLLNFVFCIEAREDEEMPESAFGSITMTKPVLACAEDW